MYAPPGCHSWRQPPSRRSAKVRRRRRVRTFQSTASFCPQGWHSSCRSGSRGSPEKEDRLGRSSAACAQTDATVGAALSVIVVSFAEQPFLIAREL